MVLHPDMVINRNASLTALDIVCSVQQVDEITVGYLSLFMSNIPAVLAKVLEVAAAWYTDALHAGPLGAL